VEAAAVMRNGTGAVPAQVVRGDGDDRRGDDGPDRSDDRQRRLAPTRRAALLALALPKTAVDPSAVFVADVDQEAAEL
jgi:hypothetical protein